MQYLTVPASPNPPSPTDLPQQVQQWPAFPPAPAPQQQAPQQMQQVQPFPGMQQQPASPDTGGTSTIQTGISWMTGIALSVLVFVIVVGAIIHSAGKNRGDAKKTAGLVGSDLMVIGLVAVVIIGVAWGLMSGLFTDLARGFGA